MHLLLVVAEHGRQLAGPPVVADRGGGVAPLAGQLGQPAHGDRLAPPLPEPGQDVRRGLEVGLRQRRRAAHVERGMRAQDAGDRADPRVRVGHGVVEDLRVGRPQGQIRPPYSRLSGPTRGMMGLTGSGIRGARAAARPIQSTAVGCSGVSVASTPPIAYATARCSGSTVSAAPGTPIAAGPPRPAG
jgi:hypothetical protein